MIGSFNNGHNNYRCTYAAEAWASTYSQAPPIHHDDRAPLGEVPVSWPRSLRYQLPRMKAWNSGPRQNMRPPRTSMPSGRTSQSGSPAGFHDLLWLLNRADVIGGQLPALYLCCGTEDFMYEDNVRFNEAARRRNIPVTVDFGPGEHEWGYWDAKIQDVLAWLPLPSNSRSARSNSGAMPARSDSAGCTRVR